MSVQPVNGIKLEVPLIRSYNNCMMNEMPRDKDGYSPLYYQSYLIQTIRNEVQEMQILPPEQIRKVRLQMTALLNAANKAEKALLQMGGSQSKMATHNKA